MIHLRQVTGVIKFYGCYTHGTTHNIILEYANGGTLENFFETVVPPSFPEERYQFWMAIASLVGVLTELRQITFQDTTKFQG